MFTKNHQINKREIEYETDNFFVLADANISFIDTFFKDPSQLNVENNIQKLKNGYVILVNKKNNTIKLYTDIFGYYQLFYIISDQSITISSDFKSLLPLSRKEPDEFAALDLILFNYTLKDRTLISDIKLLKGGGYIEINNHSFSMDSVNNFSENYEAKFQHDKIHFTDFAEKLTKSLMEEIIYGEQINLTMTGGFDSRALLAICKNENLEFNTITFGQINNIEQETIKGFIYDYSNKHKFIELDNDYIDNLPLILFNYLNLNLDNPVTLDLLHYVYVKQHLNPSNLITGFMGGELLMGPSIGSQVMLSKLSADVLVALDIKTLHNKLLSSICNFDFINNQYLESIINEYIQTISNYFYKDDKSNILDFLVNEIFRKFFGAVNKIFKNSSNLITPFMDPNVIKLLLDSKMSFLLKQPLKQNPVSNLNTKMFYAKSIIHIFPHLANTKLDRLYTIKDISNYFNLSKALYGYFQSHILKKNKKNFLRPHNYDVWFEKLIFVHDNKKSFPTISNILNNNFVLSREQYKNYLPHEKKKIINLFSIEKSYELINKYGKTENESYIRSN